MTLELLVCPSTQSKVTKWAVSNWVRGPEKNELSSVPSFDKLVFLGVKLLYNVVLVSAVQQSELAIFCCLVAKLCPTLRFHRL